MTLEQGKNRQVRATGRLRSFVKAFGSMMRKEMRDGGFKYLG